MTDLKKETKTIAKHSSIYMLANVLNKVVGFIMIPVYTRFLTPADYGTTELLALTTDLIGMIISIGIAAAMYRFYFEYATEKERNEVISTAVISFGTIALVCLFFISFFSGFLSDKILKSSEYSYYFLITFASLWFNTILQMGYSYLRIRQQSVKYLLYSLGRLLIMLFLNIYFVAIIHWGVLGVILSTLISSILFTIILMIPTLYETKLHFSFLKCKEMLRYGAPLIPTNLAAFVVHASDRFFINNYFGLTDTGLYSLGYKFGNLPNNFVAAPFMQIWEVRFFKLFKEKNAGKLFGQIFTYLCFLMFLSGLAISVLIKDALMVMSDRAYWDAWKIVSIIILSYIIFSFQYYFNMGIYFEKKTKYLAYINGSNAILNIILNIILIRRYNVWGAAYSTLICFSYKAFITYYLSNKLYKIVIEFKRIAQMFLVVLIIYFISHNLEWSSLYLSIFIKSILICTFPIILYFMNFLTVEEKEMVGNFFTKIRSMQLDFVRRLVR